MSNRHGAIELDWGDGTHTFRLGLAQLEELEEKCDTSIFQLAMQLSPQVRAARVRHVYETLRIGLIGGGMKATEALALVRRYLDELSLDESRDTAYAVALAALARVNGDEAKPPGEAAPAGSSASTSPASGQAPQ